MTGIFRSLSDLFFPRTCLNCGERLSVDEDYLCVSCLCSLQLTHFTDYYDNKLVRLFWRLLPIQKAASFLIYSRGTTASKILYDIKYHQRPQLAQFMGRIMAQRLMADGFFDGIDVIVAVPLAAKRQKQRGYNQSEYLARGIAQVTGLPVCVDGVVRAVENPTQTHLSVTQRHENVKGIFKIARVERFEGKHVLMVDDVVTTGATLLSLGETLLSAHPSNVSVLSLAWAKQ